MKKILIFIIIVVLITISCGTDTTKKDQSLKKVSFVLDWTPNTNHTGIYVAMEKGFFEDVGIDLTIIQPPEDGSLFAVATGQAQFGVGFQESLGFALTLEYPVPITAIATIINHNTSGLLSLTKSNINNFADLEGKIYATWNSPHELAILNKTMTDSSADFNKLILVPNSGADAISLLQSGIDAVWVYEGWDVMMVKIKSLDYQFYRFSDQSPVLNFYTPIIIANNSVLQENPKLVNAFLQATAQGFEYSIKNPVESAKILVKAVPELSLELIIKSQEFLANEYRADGTQWGKIDKTRWSDFYTWMYEEKLIPIELGSNGFTNEFLP